MRCKHVARARRQEVIGNFCQQMLVSEVTTWVEQHAVAFVHNRKLIGLHTFARYQIRKGDTFVFTVVV